MTGHPDETVRTWVTDLCPRAEEAGVAERRLLRSQRPETVTAIYTVPITRWGRGGFAGHQTGKASVPPVLLSYEETRGREGSLSQ